MAAGFRGAVEVLRLAGIRASWKRRTLVGFDRDDFKPGDGETSLGEEAALEDGRSARFQAPEPALEADGGP